MNEGGVLHITGTKYILYPIGNKVSFNNANNAPVIINKYMDQYGNESTITYWNSGIKISANADIVLTKCNRANICDCYDGPGSGCK